MKRNYHTHTLRCGHARGTDEELVLAAIAGGFDVLGFGDHGPWPFASGYVSTMRLPVENVGEYLGSVRQLKEKYAGQITLHAGFESEYFPRYHDHLLRLRDQGVQYFILGQHFHDSEEDTPYTCNLCHEDEGVLRYAEAAVKGIRTGLYSYIAHPDLFMAPRRGDFNCACMEATDMICQAAREEGIPLEYNLHGRYDTLRGFDRGYPSEAFWEYARKWNNTAIVGVDAHEPAELENDQLFQDSVDYLKGLGYTLTKDIRMFE